MKIENEIRTDYTQSVFLIYVEYNEAKEALQKTRDLALKKLDDRFRLDMNELQKKE